MASSLRQLAPKKLGHSTPGMFFSSSSSSHVFDATQLFDNWKLSIKRTLIILSFLYSVTEMPNLV